MHLQHFDLGAEPFVAAYEPGFFYRGFQHGAALAFLERAFEIGRPGVALIGPAGIGKSTSLRFAANRRRGGARLGQIDGLGENPVVFLTSALNAFGFGAVEAGRAELRNLLSVFVVQARQNGQQVVLQIRDPGMPTPEVADELLWMLNALASEGGFQIVFSGGEAVERLFSAPRMASLAGMFRERHALGPLAESETQDYLHFRLGVAGSLTPERIIPDVAASAIHDAAGGVPRVINRLAGAALELAAKEGRRGLDVTLVERAAAPLGLAPMSSPDDTGFRLEVHLDEMPYMKLPLGRRKVLIGRHSHNEINLRDGSVSRHHAMVVPDGERWIVVDLNSTNGTKVNGEQIKHSPLNSGDEIVVGRFRIEFRGHAGVSAVPAEEPDMRRTVVM